MPAVKHIRMLIQPDGTCSIDAVNFTDATCKSATQQIIQALGGPLMEERFKPESQRLPPQAIPMRGARR